MFINSTFNVLFVFKELIKKVLFMCLFYLL